MFLLFGDPESENPRLTRDLFILQQLYPPQIGNLLWICVIHWAILGAHPHVFNYEGITMHKHMCLWLKPYVCPCLGGKQKSCVWFCLIMFYHQWSIMFYHWIPKIWPFLVVWNMNFMTFHSVGNVIIPTDELIFFRGVGIPARLCRRKITIFKRYTQRAVSKRTEGSYPAMIQQIMSWCKMALLLQNMMVVWFMEFYELSIIWWDVILPGWLSLHIFQDG